MFDLRRPCRRRALVNRLLGHVLAPSPLQGGGDVDPRQHRPGPRPRPLDRRRQLCRLLRRLRESDLRALLRAVETAGATETAAQSTSSSSSSSCVAVAAQSAHSSSDAVVLTCGLFRWPELLLVESGSGSGSASASPSAREELRSLRFCSLSRTGGELRCCNPYHWSRTVDTKCPGTDYMEIAS